MKRRTFQVEAPSSLTAALAQALGESADTAQDRISRGTVFVDGRRVRLETLTVEAGSTVSVVLESGGTAFKQAVDVNLIILFEDREVLVVDKPPGLAAQPTPDGAPNLLALVGRHLRREAGLVHRLDKDTSGVTIFGKTREMTRALAAAFREGRAKKEYLAMTGPGFPQSGVIDAALKRDPSRVGRWRTDRTGNGLAALTRYERVSDGDRCLVRLFPATGRTHQLRAHLASLGWPMVGDRLYGGPPGPRCLLHARRLEIDGRCWEAPIPSDFT